MLTALKQNCPALRRLDIRDTSAGPLADELLTATHGRLLELAADGSHASAIAVHCEGLRKLYLQSTPHNLLDMLCVVGPTLESFEFSPHGSSNMDLVREYCPVLTHITFNIFDYERYSFSAYADMLSPYGPQISFSSLPSLPPVLLEQVVTDCPNMSCDIKTRPALLEEVLSALGKDLLSLDTDLPTITGLNGQMLGAVARSCTGLRTISLSGDADMMADAVEELLLAHKPLLSNIQLNIGELGNSMTVFEKLGISFCGFLPEDGALDHIARGAPLLEVVHIVLLDMEEIPGFEERIEAIVRSFATCPNLQQLEIEDCEGAPLRFDSVANLCAHLRLRKGNCETVTVFEVEYLL